MERYEYLCLGEVAARLRCSKNTVRRRIRAGLVPAIRETRRLLIRSTDVDAYLKSMPPPLPVNPPTGVGGDEPFAAPRTPNQGD